ncbi:hypothetical protein AB6A40_000757 [Gnathostoma spinigerum]|uniref:THAP4-like heme-binding domain-containing protein n=1 Tax=Gnathostoma spinigerum TaxID=75299 RepID=A0ABD6E2P5_9BILA
MMKNVFLIFFIHIAAANIEDRYNLMKMPYDLKPIRGFIGLWELESKGGQMLDIHPPDLIDIAINPLTEFGARSANLTYTYFDENKKVWRSDYGFMPVKNASKADPRVHIAHLTTSSEGFSQMEQGQLKDDTMYFHLKQFLRRSFLVGRDSNNLKISEFERMIKLIDFRHMMMKVRAQTASMTEAYTAYYRKISQ